MSAYIEDLGLFLPRRGRTKGIRRQDTVAAVGVSRRRHKVPYMPLRGGLRKVLLKSKLGGKANAL